MTNDSNEAIEIKVEDKTLGPIRPHEVLKCKVFRQALLHVKVLKAPDYDLVSEDWSFEGPISIVLNGIGISGAACRFQLVRGIRVSAETAAICSPIFPTDTDVDNKVGLGCRQIFAARSNDLGLWKLSKES